MGESVWAYSGSSKRPLTAFNPNGRRCGPMLTPEGCLFAHRPHAHGRPKSLESPIDVELRGLKPQSLRQSRQRPGLCDLTERRSYSHHKSGRHADSRRRSKGIEFRSKGGTKSPSGRRNFIRKCSRQPVQDAPICSLRAGQNGESWTCSACAHQVETLPGQVREYVGWARFAEPCRFGG